MNTNLLEQLASPENLLLAWRSVRGNIPKNRRARSAGPDGISLADFEQDLPAQLNVLQDMLIKERYRPQPPIRHVIPKRDGGRREIAVLTVTDRVIQRAAQQVLEPLWEPHFLDCSFGYRPGRSIEDALHCAQQLRSQNRRWVVDADIQNCFASLDHEILVGQLRRQVHDRRVMRLIQQWLEVGILQAGPPADDSGLPEQVHSITRWAQRGADWLLDRTAQDADPYAAARYEYPRYVRLDPADDYGASDWLPLDHQGYRTGADEESLRRSALQRMATNSLLLGASWARPAITSLGSKAILFVKSPLGRHILKKSVLASGGLAGIAAIAAITASLIYQKAGPLPAGVLQGSPLSPLLANIYLHLFDLMMVRRQHALVRFADDWVAFAPTYQDADHAYRQAEWALGRLRLDLNPEKTRIRHADEKVQWLGGTIP